MAIAGAIHPDTVQHTTRWPDGVELAKVIYENSEDSHLTLEAAEWFAESIISNNDEEDFEAAWQYAAIAFSREATHFYEDFSQYPNHLPDEAS